MTNPPENETREEKYQRQTSESFALIGRFVQSFEQMVHRTRIGSVMLLSKSPTHQQLLNRVFHSEALSAVPLWDIFRNLVTAIVTEFMPKLSDDERTATLQILRQMDGEYKELAKRRNQLVHGTWLIGWASAQDTDFSHMGVVKMKWKATGELQSSPLKDADELKSITADCDRLAGEVQTLWMLFQLTDGPRVLQNFTKSEKRWVLTNSLKS